MKLFRILLQSFYAVISTGGKTAKPLR